MSEIHCQLTAREVLATEQEIETMEEENNEEFLSQAIETLMQTTELVESVQR